MSERLDKEAFHEFMIEWMDSKDKTKIRLEFWQAIEADREAVRAEAREELLKDHFEGGERVIWVDDFNKEHHGKFGFIEDGSQEVLTYGASGTALRRPAKKRQMTGKEIAHAIVETLGQQWIRVHDISDAAKIEIANVYQIPTEVEE